MSKSFFVFNGPPFWIYITFTVYISDGIRQHSDAVYFNGGCIRNSSNLETKYASRAVVSLSGLFPFKILFTCYYSRKGGLFADGWREEVRLPSSFTRCRINGSWQRCTECKRCVLYTCLITTKSSQSCSKMPIKPRWSLSYEPTHLRSPCGPPRCTCGLLILHGEFPLLPTAKRQSLLKLNKDVKINLP